MVSLDKVFGFFGGRRALAESLKVTPQAISKWERSKIPAARAIQVEQITEGKFTVKELRPDLFNINESAA